MNMLKTLALVSVVALGATATLASAAPQCPPGQKLECLPQSSSGPGQANKPAPCRCVLIPDSGSRSGGGKAEIKRKNVPQVKSSKQPGPND